MAKRDTPACSKCGEKAKGTHHVHLSQPFGTRLLEEDACPDCVAGRLDEAMRRGGSFSIIVIPPPEEA